MKVLRDDQVEVATRVIHGIEGAEAQEAAMLVKEAAEVPEVVIRGIPDSKEEAPGGVTLKDVDSEVVEVQGVGTLVIEVDSGVEE